LQQLQQVPIRLGYHPTPQLILRESHTLKQISAETIVSTDRRRIAETIGRDIVVALRYRIVARVVKEMDESLVLVNATLMF
jgi:hypothetical protein